MCESFDRDTKGSGKSKVCKFNVAFFCDEDVLWFEISVHDSVRMAIINSLDDLINKAFDLLCWEGFLVLPEVLFEVILYILENEVEAGVCVNDFSQPVDIVRQVQIMKAPTE